MLFFAALVAFVMIAASMAATNPLGPYTVSDVTVSGLSSGAFMAVQMHVTYSSVVNGSAIFAGVSFLNEIFKMIVSPINFAILLFFRALSTAPRLI
jgi:poly(3-hydroxybutyrate) depolymerase